MASDQTIFAHVDYFARKHPYLIGIANCILLLFVTFVLLMTTEAPVVLYQAF